LDAGDTYNEKKVPIRGDIGTSEGAWRSIFFQGFHTKQKHVPQKPEKYLKLRRNYFIGDAIQKSAHFLN
jgi:hypothetical protein